MRETFQYTFPGGVVDTFDEDVLTNADQTVVYFLHGALHRNLLLAKPEQHKHRHVVIYRREPDMKKAAAAG